MLETRRKAESSEAETPRRRWSEAKKRRIVSESLRGGESATAVARRHGVHVSLLFKWRRRYRPSADPGAGFVPVVVEESEPASEAASRSRRGPRARPCCPRRPRPLDEARLHRDGGPLTSPAHTRRYIEARLRGYRRDAFETMRDLAADAYRAETGDAWRPRRGSHVSQTGHLTSAAIDARDFQRARKDRELRAHLPQGTLVAIAGGWHVRRRERRHRPAREGQGEVRRHGPDARRRPRGRAHRRAVGQAERRTPGGVQARLERPRTRRPVPAQR